jgi:two-component system OmpR family sensor kinase
MSTGRIGQAWESLRGLPDRTPLRVKMVTAVLALTAIALAVISIAGISVLKNYLLNQADNTLQNSYAHQAQNAVGQYLSGASPNTSYLAYVIWIPSGGGRAVTVLEQVQGGFHSGAGLGAGAGVPSQQPLPPPQIPDSAAWLAANNNHEVTVPGQSGGYRWRVLVEAASFQNGNGSFTSGTMIVAVNVTSVYNAIGQLTYLDLVVSGLLLLVILIVGIAVVRASLRPLTDIEKTAGAIAAGDLTRRVPDLDPRTEVGRLAQSLNAMLSQIEMAFDARAESEFAARRSEERMRQFVADASHELRTPLTAIRGFAEYYRQRGGVAEIPGAAGSLPPGSDAGAAADEAGAAAAEAGAVVSPRHGSNAEPEDRAGSLARADLDRIMQRVEQESSRMGGLVEDMLLLARLDQQRPLERSTVDMLTLAADAVHDARVVAPDRSINLTVGSGAALLVVGDEARLRQVIGNLINNALNHTPERSAIEVRVRLGSLDEWRAAAAAARRGAAHGAGQAAFAAARPNVQPFPAVVFEIADQGPGLTQPQAEHVFERFYRADQARTRQSSGGAGLGLAIVAALVAAHGGNVWVESPPGGGAIFRIAIPLAPEARHAPYPDDGTDPDILNSRRTLSPQPVVPPEPGGPVPSASPGPGYPAQPAFPEPGYPAPAASPEPGHPSLPPASPEPGYPAPGDPAPSGSPGRPTAPPLPKRRPGYSGHTRI